MTAATSRLTKVNRGVRRDPLRFIFYGQEGTGKTTLAAHAPKPIFIDVEDGSGRMDVARYSFRDDERGHVPGDFADVLAALDDLATNEHSFETVVIDTVDRLEAMIWASVCRKGSKPGQEFTNIEAFGYGKGYALALDEWRLLALKLDRVRARGMSTVLLSHSLVKAFKDPTGPDHDRYQLALHDKAAGLLKGWSDVIGFLQFEEGVNAKSGTERAKGWSTGKRILRLSRTAAYDAKGRGGMPDEILIEPADPWGPIAAAIDAAAGLTADDLNKRIDAEVNRIGGGDVVAKKIAAALKKADGDTATLNRLLQELQKKEPITTTPKEGA
jgi:hypothetical protein